MQSFIEIPSITLLDEQRSMVNELKALARSLGLEFGWHYLLDLTWILSNLGSPAGKRIMDAGAGTGMMQWYLAEHAAQVLSVDRGSRADLPLRFRSRFRVRGLRKEDLLSTRRTLRARLGGESRLWAKLSNQASDLMSIRPGRRAPGSVIIYNQDLQDLRDIADSSLDAVVAVSALEHNPPDDLPRVAAELMRVLIPGGVLLATLCAARDQDWFHQPSQGWCYTDLSLRRLFDLPASVPSNYAYYDELFTALVSCAELRNSLAGFYFRSGDNGMPWGRWDPQYQPVGVCIVKQ
jgi:ubiquinone/menaquinone biosynthesis C-methylase UbiE